MGLEAVSIRELRGNARSRLLSGRIVDSPDLAALEAEMLLSAALELSAVTLIAEPNYRASSAQFERFNQLLGRRLRSEPMAYILGRKEFYSRDFHVSPAVLIPRPETEMLVDRSLALLEADAKSLEVIDIGTGSGNIIISLVCELLEQRGEEYLNRSSFIATDSSSEALQVARVNAERWGVAGRIQLICTDLISDVQLAAGIEQRIIVCNPPYIPQGTGLPRQVEEFEPLQALFSGARGLDTIKRLISSWAESPAGGQSGALLFEIGQGQEADVESLVRAAGFDKLAIFKDLQGIPRVVEVCR